MEISPLSSFARNIINQPALIGRSMDSVENEDTDSSISIIYSLKYNFCRQTHFLIHFRYLIIVQKYEQQKALNQLFCSLQLRLPPLSPDGQTGKQNRNVDSMANLHFGNKSLILARRSASFFLEHLCQRECFPLGDLRVILTFETQKHHKRAS